MASHLDRITTDPAVFGGRPCVRGLRVRVKDILDMLASGASRSEILEYAAQHVDHPVIRPA